MSSPAMNYHPLRYQTEAELVREIGRAWIEGATTGPVEEAEVSVESRLAAVEAKLDELLQQGRKRELREDYERLTAEWRARMARRCT